MSTIPFCLIEAIPYYIRPNNSSNYVDRVEERRNAALWGGPLLGV
jgi:hypothetical protein